MGLIKYKTLEPAAHAVRAPQVLDLVLYYAQLLTAIIDQTNHKEIFESVASQRFQKFPWFGFERKAL
ncbi:hypothetical protein [Pseudanabaena sp. UWO310]|uniref:hypothetical protein n=1 Tax=Pseudanabaena sp. UWO310 TaxID=2480795 RepID=UPI0011572674|nr:hypothetical protein [Pseudanabaena sp. UWO310]TYQ26545.1 hypothetical protein PseudUWO310_17140 [Pseudanabaena sp. UWO310]